MRHIATLVLKSRSVPKPGCDGFYLCQSEIENFQPSITLQILKKIPSISKGKRGFLCFYGAQEKQVAFWKSKYYQWFISEPLKKAVPKAVLCPQSFYTIAITLQNSLSMCSSSIITSNADPERLDTRGPMGCMKRQSFAAMGIDLSPSTSLRFH